MSDNCISKKKRILLCGTYFGVYLFLFQMILEPLIYHKFGFDRYLIADTLLNAFMLVFFVLMLNDWLKKEGTEFLQKPRRSVYAVLLYFCLLLLVTFAFTLFIADPLHLGEAENQANNEAFMGRNLWGFLLSSLCMAPFIEEIIFRGCIFYPLEEKYNLFVGALFSGLFFGCMHVIASIGAGNWLNLLYLVEYGMCGFILSLSVGKTRSIWTGIFVHALFNLFGVITMFL